MQETQLNEAAYNRPEAESGASLQAHWCMLIDLGPLEAS